MSIGNMLIDDNVSVRVSGASYAVLWVPIAALGGLYLSLALVGHRDAWSVAGILILLGLIGTACLMRLRFTLTSDAISYRALLRTVRIPIQDIAAIHGESIGREYSKKGIAKGPGFVLTIETVPGRSSLSVSMKPFSKNDLRRLFVTAQARGIPVRLNEVVAAMIRG